MNNQTVAVLTIALLGVLFAFAIPQMIGASQGTQTTEYHLSDGERVVVTDGLEIAVNDTSDTETTVTITDSETHRTDEFSINEGETVAYDMPGGTGNVSVRDTTNQTASLDVDYSATYGWSGAGEAFADHIGLILILMAFLIIVGGMVVVIK